MEKFYNAKRLLDKCAHYSIVWGKRSSGKTFNTILFCLDCYFNGYKFPDGSVFAKGTKFAYVRRWGEDFKNKRFQKIFTDICSFGYINKLSNGKYDGIDCIGKNAYLTKYDEKTGKYQRTNLPICYGYALNENEHDKGGSDSEVRFLIFDEFLSRSGYLPNEIDLFFNTISTVKRKRDDFKVIMLGNTISQFCPYFAEMGLKDFKNIKPNEIKIYSSQNTPLKIACEFNGESQEEMCSDGNYFFDFQNQKLKMITSGQWEMESYPLAPKSIKKNDALYSYFILFEDIILQCDIIALDDSYFTYIHNKTTPLQFKPNDIIFSLENHPEKFYIKDITRPTYKKTKKIYDFFLQEKVFYQSNNVGEIVREYLIECKNRIVK